MVVEDPEKIRLLGSPIRQDIVDHLDSAGASTVAELARALGRPADRLYYHVRLLREAGILVQRPGESGQGSVVALPAESLSIKYRAGDAEVVEAIEDAVGTMLRSAERRFRAALEGETGAVAVEGEARNLWASRVRGRLTESDLKEANELIRRLHGLFRRAREGGGGEGRMHEVNVVLCPLPEAPAP